MDLDGYASVFRDASNEIDKFKEYLDEKISQYDNGTVSGVTGTVATSTTKFVAGLGQGILLPLDYIANGYQQVAGAVTDVDYSAASRDIRDTHKAIGKAYDYVMDGGLVTSAKNVVNDAEEAITTGRTDAVSRTTQTVWGVLTLREAFKGALKGKPKVVEESASGPGTNASGINPELQARAKAFRKYKETKGLSKTVKVTTEQFENFKRGNSGQNGQKLYTTKSNYKDPKVSQHGNSHSASGPHDVYVVRNAKTGEVLRFGETGRDVDVRLTEHVRKLKKGHNYTDDVVIEKLKTVEGKGAAKIIENKYIKTYEKLYKKRPPFNFNDH